MKPLPNYLSLLSSLPSSSNFPTQMNIKDKGNKLELKHNRIIYTGEGKNDDEAGSIRSLHPIPPSIFYFEIRIISKGRDGHIGIGISSSTAELSRLPGWEPNSFGYHGDDGHSFECSGSGKEYGPTFTTGDVVGCGVNFYKKEIFFTKNGVFIGVAFKNVRQLETMDLYACVGLRTPREEVEVEFSEFVFNIELYIREQKEALYRSISEVSCQNVSAFLVEFLLFEGYPESAQLLNISIESKPLEVELVKEATMRRRIKNLILNGELDGAVELALSNYPGVIDKNDLVYFYIKCRKFVEIIKKSLKSDDEYTILQSAIEYGQSIQDEFRDDERKQVQERLTETFSLLAYPDPVNSDVGYLLNEKYRHEIADLLNERIYYYKYRKRYSQVEMVTRQLSVVLEKMKETKEGSASLVKMEEFYQ